MTTSGSVDFNPNKNQAIKEAYELIGIGMEGESLSAEDYSSASRTLNIMLKAWQSDGLQLWAQKRATVFLEKGKREYSLGPSGDHATHSYTETAIKVAASATDTAIDVDSTSGMSAAGYIGIVLDDGTIHWTTIASVTDSDTVVIDDGLASAAAVDNAVYFYTTKMHRPLRIIEAYRRDSSNQDTQVMKISQEEYAMLGDKMSSGPPVNLFYKPTLVNGTLKVFPAPDDVTDSLEIIYHRPFEDMDSTTDTLDFPQYWLEAITYGLAVRLGDKNGTSENRMSRLEAKAERAKFDAMGFDVEDASLLLAPDYS